MGLAQLKFVIKWKWIKYKWAKLIFQYMCLKWAGPKLIPDNWDWPLNWLYAICALTGYNLFYDVLKFCHAAQCKYL
jgi:hypothetical protein